MLTLEQAKQALVAAETKAKDLGVQVATVVVDEHGSLIAASRMDGAFFISPKFALTKAFTAANLKTATEGLLAYAAENKPYYGLNTLFAGELTEIAGGLPVIKDGQVVGAIGVGGATDTSLDAACAKAAVAALEQ